MAESPQSGSSADSRRHDPDEQAAPRPRAKDVHEDPFTVGGTPTVTLRCADCDEELEIGGVRYDQARGQSPYDTPADPLCLGCFAAALAIWGEKHPQVALYPIGPASQSTPSGPEVRRVCPRCNGSGTTPWGLCFSCRGLRWTYVEQRRVRRTARWWQTYQQNRTPDSETGARPDDDRPPCT